MELLLNLVWLLLAVPAYWLWQRARDPRERHTFSSLQCLLALACVLVILFPVVSATDDVHVMRAEIEESPSSKRSLRHAGGDKSANWHVFSSAPAIAACPTAIPVLNEVGRQQLLKPSALVSSAAVNERCGRAPPVFFLG